MARWVGALLCSHEALSLNLRHQCKKSDVATDVCNLQIVGQRQLDSIAQNRELPIYGRPCLKAVRKVTEDSWCPASASMCANAGWHTRTHVWVCTHRKEGRKTEGGKESLVLAVLLVHGHSSGGICGWLVLRGYLWVTRPQGAASNLHCGAKHLNNPGVPQYEPIKMCTFKFPPISSSLFTTSQLQTQLLCFLEVLVVSLSL